MLHGRKDKRVVPRMTEIMARQLEIEGKFHEVVWFDDEAHGWERRENQRKAAEKTLDFILAHLPPTVKP
jgi:dipeptidyl aminopeptidase/acylaminoacyl peptidase